MRGGRHNHTGKKYNRLTALSYYGRPKTKTLWWFQCDCGKRITKDISSVVRGHTKSCGCLQPETMSNLCRLPDLEVVLNRSYTAHQRQSQRRALKSYLTRAQYAEIVTTPCHYCGNFSNRFVKRKRGPKEPMQVNSADRINNEPFYTPSNTVSACFVCQRMKSDLLEQEFVEHIQSIAKFQSTLSDPCAKIDKTADME